MKTHYIRIKSPKDLMSKRVENEILALLIQGVKTSDIALIMAFITDEPLSLIAKFRVIKNNIRFNSPLLPAFDYEQHYEQL